MISIFVLAIGLLGVAALLPVASLQARKANVDDRKSAALQAEVRDFKTRGFLRPDYWLYADGHAMLSSSGPPYNFLADSGSALSTMQPVAIDPLMIASVGTSGSTSLFASNGGSLVMPRITLTTMLGAAATQACFIQDDMGFKISTTDTTALPTGGFNANGTRRLFQSQYSWLATLVPVYGDLQPSYSRNSMIMSLVVFNQRRFQSAPVSSPAAQTDTERAATVSSFGGATSIAYGGGDLILTGTANPWSVNLNPGEWLMLGWMVNDVPQSSGGYGGPRPYFRWYRIVAASPPLLSSGVYTRAITVNGADINLNSMVANSAMAFIYDGAVGVYERPVHLEGPSLWSN